MTPALFCIAVVVVLVCSGTTTLCQVVDGGWTDWSLIKSQCNATCAGGYQRRYRTCANPAPQNGGRVCVSQNGSASMEETGLIACNTHPCASEWSVWSNCSGVCGRGVQVRRRLCSGQLCTDNQYGEETVDCNTWNKTACPNPCGTVECPEYSICEDKSTAVEPRAECKCTLGYSMSSDRSHCFRAPPPKPTPRPIPTLAPVQKIVAVVITKSASTLLIVLVGATLAIFLLLRIFTPDRVIQMNMELAIVMAHMFLMFPAETAQNEELCRLVSISVHYFFTACFMFMLLESLHMYSLVAYVVHKNGLFSRVQNTLLGWVVPAFTVLITLCFELGHYGGRYHCWLQLDTSLTLAQFVPVVVLMAAIFTLIEAAGAARYTPLTDVDKQQLVSARISQRSNLIIMPLVFASWVVGMLSEYEQNLALYSAFSLLNGFVGVAIFFFHSTGNQQVRALLVKLLHSLKQCRRRRATK